MSTSIPAKDIKNIAVFSEVSKQGNYSELCPNCFIDHLLAAPKTQDVCIDRLNVNGLDIQPRPIDLGDFNK